MSLTASPGRILLLGLAGLTFLQAGFAAPRGKGFAYGPEESGLSLAREIKARNKVGVHEGGYLSARLVPPVRVAQRESASVASPGISPDLLEKATEPGARPTLRGFLAYLETERAEEARRRKEAEQVEQEAESPSGSGEAPGEGAGEGDPGQRPEGSESGNPSAMSGPANGGNTKVIFRTEDPFSSQAASLFPRPQRQNLLEERFFIYFPIEDAEGRQSQVILPGSYESIFLPPGTSGMRSSATLREGP